MTPTEHRNSATTGPPARVAVDATPLLGSPTGVGAFVRGLLGQLPLRADVSVDAYGLTWRGRRHLRAAVPPGVVMGRRPMPARPLRWAWQRADRPTVEWWTGPVDVVHGTNFVVPPTRRAGAVVTVHDLTCLHYPELCHPATLAYPALLRAAVERGALVHAVSRSVADDLVADLGVDADRVVVAHHGVPPVPAPAPPGPHPITAVVGEAEYVLALGTVEPRKDLPLLVRAFDAIAGERPGVVLVLAGPDGWGAADLARALDQARHTDRIVRLGWVSDSQRAALLRGATVLAYPSRYEGFGFPPLEAMTVGVPVVATRAGALPEVLGDAAALVPVGEVDPLAETLASVLDDRARRESLVEAGLRRAQRYRWDRCADALVALYRRAAGG